MFLLHIFRPHMRRWATRNNSPRKNSCFRLGKKLYLIILFLLCTVETFLFFDFMRKKPLSSIYHQAFVEIKTRHFCDRKKSVCISVKDADKTLFSSCTTHYLYI